MKRPLSLSLRVLGTEVLAVRYGHDDADPPQRDVTTGAAVLEHAGARRVGFDLPPAPHATPDDRSPR